MAIGKMGAHNEEISQASLSGSDLAPSLTIVVLLSLGLGAATLLYTALDRLLLHPLNVSHPETLVRAVESRPPTLSYEWFPYSTYEAMRKMRSFEDLAVEGSIDTVVNLGGGAQPVVAQMVSGSYFSMLGGVPEVGRILNQADEQAKAGTVPVVLSDHFWRREFAASTSAIGSTLSLQGRLFTIVGVVPSRFYGTSLDSSPDLWLPLAAQPLLSNISLNDSEPDRHFSIVGRLKSESTSTQGITQAQAEFSGIYRANQQSLGDFDPERKGMIVPVNQGTFALRDQFGHALALLLWGLATLLLMVCANVAGLLLAKQSRREKDTAVRMALGAGRSRLVMSALVESAFLGLAGACGGLAVSYLCAPLLLRLLPAGQTPLPISLTPDWKIDLFTVVLALAVSLVFGAIPAWMTSRVAPQQALRRGSATRRTGVLRRWLLSFQTSATLILLVGTGLLIHTFYILSNTSPGFDVEHLIAFTLNPYMAGDRAKVSASFPVELQQRLQSLPGIRSVSFASAALMHRLGIKTSVALPGQKILSTAFLNTSFDTVSSTFFDTMGIPVLSGRSFSSADVTRSGPTPTVINEAFARQFFPNQNPLGRSFGTGGPGEVAKATNIVVGVAGDSKYRTLREAFLPIYYVPIKPQDQLNSQFYVYVRTQGPPTSIIQAAQKVLYALNPQLPFSSVMTMREQLSESLWQERLLVVLAGVFSVISILMAATGLYGLLSFETSQRTREFGIRSAVGAQKKDVAILLIKGLLAIVIPGMAIGFLACILLAPIIESALYRVKPFDPLALSGSLLTVGLICAITAWQPLRRAMNVDPSIVLRDE